ncbi:MAG: hypothetical protein OXG23_13705 [Chloroflexi bacterium]|nr:hypothetical protein [Chloroflexota bacterium]
MDYGLLAFSLVSFAFITFAAFQIGQLATRFHLPLISGYLLSGILAGPFILQFMDMAHVEALRFPDAGRRPLLPFPAGRWLSSPSRPAARWRLMSCVAATAASAGTL